MSAADQTKPTDLVLPEDMSEELAGEFWRLGLSVDRVTKMSRADLYKCIAMQAKNRDEWMQRAHDNGWKYEDEFDRDTGKARTPEEYAARRRR